MLVGVLGSREAVLVHSVEAVILLVWSYGGVGKGRWLTGALGSARLGFVLR